VIFTKLALTVLYLLYPLAGAPAPDAPETTIGLPPAPRAQRSAIDGAAGTAHGGTDVPILLYHYLTDADTLPSPYYVTRDLFDRQMAALRAYGYETVTLQDFMNYRNGLAAPPPRPVIITFDDGHEGIYTHAHPILDDRNMKATLFVTTGFLGETESGRKRPWLVWSPEVETLYAAGFAIEAHSVTHPNLTQLSGYQAWHEIADSRLDIQDRIGAQAEFFAYPGGNGDGDPTVRSLVQQAGYQAAVAARPEALANTATSDIWALPRITIRQDHAVDLDPADPESFFLRRVDPDFPIPDITLGAVQVLNAGGTPGSWFCPGETITLTVAVTNNGDPVTASIALHLDDDADHSAVYYSKVTAARLPSAQTTTLTYPFYLPGNLAPGPHYAAFSFHDEHQVLGFGHSDWLAPFTLADTCHRRYLPAMYR
jgi:peptidoglycan/xylan/chitin deacetylase (PgdA/CDA1 family)